MFPLAGLAFSAVVLVALMFPFDRFFPGANEAEQHVINVQNIFLRHSPFVYGGLAVLMLSAVASVALSEARAVFALSIFLFGFAANVLTFKEVDKHEYYPLTRNRESTFQFMSEKMAGESWVSNHIPKHLFIREKLAGANIVSYTEEDLAPWMVIAIGGIHDITFKEYPHEIKMETADDLLQRYPSQSFAASRGWQFIILHDPATSPAGRTYYLVTAAKMRLLIPENELALANPQ